MDEPSSEEQESTSSFPYLFLMEAEENEIEQISCISLLRQAFEALSKEKDTNGNTFEYRRLQKEWAIRLLQYWNNIYLKGRDIFLAREGAKIEDFAWVEFFKEEEGVRQRVSISLATNYENDDEWMFLIEKASNTENSKFRLTFLSELGIVDSYRNPATIECWFTNDTELGQDEFYRVIFRADLISTIERTLILANKDDLNAPAIKDTRVLDTSTFGVQR